VTGNPEAVGARIDSVWRASDEALLAGLGAGDPDAALAFVRRYQRRVFGLAFTMLGDRAAAEDVAQEAMVRAWRHAGAFDARRGSVTTWLLSITRNLAVDAIRAGRVVPTVDDVLLAAVPPSRDDLPGDASVAVDELRLVRRAIDSLPDEQRRALLLARLGGLTAAEIAARESIPLGTAKTRIRAALLRVRDELDATPDQAATT